ncbi:MAG: hypothetical protein IPP35_01565 [Elusimicrobia bacterium]|nr:hypothetical protein [Elusimicrobiota bacterium]
MDLPPLHRALLEETVRRVAPAGSKIVFVRETRTASVPSGWTQDALHGWSFMGRMMHHQTHSFGKEKS